jgi:hypothetical protein
MQFKSLFPFLACLLILVMVLPVLSTTYTVTVTFVYSTETVWTDTFYWEVPDSTVNLTVTQDLYDWIVAFFGNDTVEMPFEVPLDPFLISDPPLPRVIVYTLRVESDPSGLTIVFQPMHPGDPNNDGRVDIVDIVLLAIHFGGSVETGGYDLFSDLNLDFQIDIVDLVNVAMCFGTIY